MGATETIDPPRPGTPYWTAYSQPEGDTEPIDPLAFDMYAERLGNEILPGITNRTFRLRYLGMVCAGLELTAHSEEAGMHPLRARRAAFLPFERGWAFAMTLAADGDLKEPQPGSNRRGLKPRYRGFRGANLALAQWRRTRGDKKVHPFNYRFLAAPGSQGGLGAYLVTLNYAGLVDRSTLTLRAAGRELAHAFLGPVQRTADRLIADRAWHRGWLTPVGEALDLGEPTPREAQIVRRALFEDGRGLANACGRIPHRVRDAGTPEEALRAIARRDGDPLERAAQYALDFDPLRRAALGIFTTIGQALTTKSGRTTFDDLDDEVVAAAGALRSHATRLAEQAAPPAVSDLGRLAERLRTAMSPQDVVSILLAWHAEHRTSWIAEVSPGMYELRRHGAFEERDGFHGYTMGSALELLREVNAAT